jgi:hypothetical protein
MKDADSCTIKKNENFRDCVNILLSAIISRLGAVTPHRITLFYFTLA